MTTVITNSPVMLEAAPDHDPGHDQDKQAQHSDDQHMGDYLASIRVMMKLSIVQIVTMRSTVSIRVFTVSTRVLSGNTMNTVRERFAGWAAVGLPRLRSA